MAFGDPLEAGGSELASGLDKDSRASHLPPPAQAPKKRERLLLPFDRGHYSPNLYEVFSAGFQEATPSDFPRDSQIEPRGTLLPYHAEGSMVPHVKTEMPNIWK